MTDWLSETTDSHFDTGILTDVVVNSGVKLHSYYGGWGWEDHEAFSEFTGS